MRSACQETPPTNPKNQSDPVVSSSKVELHPLKRPRLPPQTMPLRPSYERRLPLCIVSVVVEEYSLGTVGWRCAIAGRAAVAWRRARSGRGRSCGSGGRRSRSSSGSVRGAGRSTGNGDGAPARVRSASCGEESSRRWARGRVGRSALPCSRTAGHPRARGLANHVARWAD